MSAQSRKYSTRDYGTCRNCLENITTSTNQGLQRTLIFDAGGAFTTTDVQRLRRLNLIDGDELSTFDLEWVKLSGLGVKTAREAQRLGIPATV